MSPKFGKKLYARVFEPEEPSMEWPDILISPLTPKEPDAIVRLVQALPSSFGSNTYLFPVS